MVAPPSPGFNLAPPMARGGGDGVPHNAYASAMGKRIEVDVPHTLGVEEAVARMAALGEYFRARYQARVAWPTAQRARLSASYALVRLEVDLDVRADRVVVSGEVPRLLATKARDYTVRKVQNYLDPATPLAALPKG